MNALRYILARLKEPSTHAGIAALLVLLATLFPAYREQVAAFGAFFAAIAAASPDPTSTTTDAPAPALAAEVNLKD